MQIKSSLLALVFVVPVAVGAADFETTNLGPDLGARTDKFLAGSTAEARAQIASFTDNDLQKVAHEFKKSHSTAEQRIFWLSEELYRRNAERVAAERIRYLYYAVLAALLVLTGFAFMTWRQSRGVNPPAAPAAPVRANIEAEVAVGTRKVTKKPKGKSKR